MTKFISYLMIGSVVVLFCVGFKLRSDIPYDFEVVPHDGGIAIINTTPWADRDCQVSVETNGKKYVKTLPSAIRYVMFDKLDSDKTYHINIRRSDFPGKIKYRPFQSELMPRKINEYIVLVGASVGKKWDLRQLSTRRDLESTFFGYRGVYEFDKSPLVDNLINSPLKPDAVIIKECAAYFPRDIESSMKQIKVWVKQLKDSNIEPILATVVPITKKRAKNDPAAQQGINAFNTAIRKYGHDEAIRILDLQAALSTDDGDRYLAEQYADSDGLHLKNVAYREHLDTLVIDLINSGAGCSIVK